MMTKITTTNNATEMIDLAIFKDFFFYHGEKGSSTVLETKLELILLQSVKIQQSINHWQSINQTINDLLFYLNTKH